MRESELKNMAQHVVNVIRDMDVCTSVADLGKVYDAWKLWAEANGVARQIREHMSKKFFALRRDLGGGVSAEGGARQPSDGQLSDRSQAMSGGDQ